MRDNTTKVKCEKCKNVIDILKSEGNDERFNTRQFNFGRKELTVIVYTCKMCGNNQIMQIDDEQTLKLRDAINELIVKAINGSQNDKVEARKKISHMDMILTNKRKKLEKKYTKFLKKCIDKQKKG